MEQQSTEWSNRYGNVVKCEIVNGNCCAPYFYARPEYHDTKKK